MRSRMRRRGPEKDESPSLVGLYWLSSMDESAIGELNALLSTSSTDGCLARRPRVERFLEGSGTAALTADEDGEAAGAMADDFLCRADLRVGDCT